MNVQISAAVLLMGVPVAKITFRPLFFSKIACVFRNTPCDFLLYDGSTPLTPRCMAVANPRCLYSCASSTSKASMPISSKFSTSSVRRSSISIALTSAFCKATARFFSSLAVRFFEALSASPASCSSNNSISRSACRVIIFFPSGSSSFIFSRMSIFSSILSCTKVISLSSLSGINSKVDCGTTIISQSL